jgi:peptide chain release factor 2
LLIDSRTCGGVFDLAGKQERVVELEKRAADPNLWGDQESAQNLMRELSLLRSEIEHYETVGDRLDDALELGEIGDLDLLEDLTTEVDELAAEVDRLDFQSMLSGRYDREDVILAIHAGAGGTDAQDWAEMLQRMYLRWAESRGFSAEVYSSTEGEEAGIKSTTLAISGTFAFGYLKAERGVHRLVRLSPFDANHRRHTSFVLVEAWPDVAGDVDVDIRESDLQIDRFRSAGAGGQHVQKNETAIRITHTPTGIIVSCQNQRSQKQNLESAMKVLRARLLALEQQKRDEEMAKLKGGHVDAGWGNQIRSYVLHPYQMVKDHRTDYEVGNVNAVLDGRLDEFMEAYLRSAAGMESV